MKNNWFNVYYRESESLSKRSRVSKLRLEFDKQINLSNKNYYDSLIANARKIADENNLITVLLSGGINSEVIVRLNHDLGIKQNVVTMRFEDNINIKDINSSIQICKELGIKHTIIDFNLKKFFENEAFDLYYQLYSPRIELLPRLKWHTMFDNTVIFGDGDPYWRRASEGDYSSKSLWTPIFYEHNFINYIFSNLYNTDAISWYLYTPDIHANFPKIPLIKKLLDDHCHGKISTLTSRVSLYKEIWPSILPKEKLLGYEGFNDTTASMPDFMEDFYKNVMTEDVPNTTIILEPQTFLEIFK
jgi:hypothetical protein